MKCKECGEEIGINQNFCRYCGTPTGKIDGSVENIGQTKWCRNCGAPLMSGNAFCTRCGTPILGVDATDSVVEEDRHEGSLARKLGIAVFTFITFVFSVFAGYYLTEKYGMLNRNINEMKFPEVDEDKETAPEVSEPKENVSDVENETAENGSKKAVEPKESDDTVITEAVDLENKRDMVDLEKEVPRIDAANFRNVRATSYLEESKYNIVHSPERVIDGDLTTGWAEGVSGQGIGESVTVDFDEEYLVSGIEIYAGYQKTESLYNKNSRPKEIYLEFSDGSGEVYILEDTKDVQNMEFAVPVITNSITLRIDSVYPGDKYEDTVITEMVLY